VSDAEAPAWPCLSLKDGRPWLAVSVQPNARRTAADGLHDGALRVRLCAPPVDGKANALLVDWLAGELGVAKRAIAVERGQSSRRKSLSVEAPVSQVSAWLALTLAGAASG
jgi:uncharacterized protein (TIGR00251 family)